MPEPMISFWMTREQSVDLAVAFLARGLPIARERPWSRSNSPATRCEVYIRPADRELMIKVLGFDPSRPEAPHV